MNRVVIPIHNEAGRLIGYAGRYPGEDVPDEEPKYLLPPNLKKSKVLFNFHRALEPAKEQQQVNGNAIKLSEI